MNDGSHASAAYSRYAICKAMGWDFYIYERQPPFFLEEIAIFMNYEVKRQKADARKMSASPRGHGYKRT